MNRGYDWRLGKVRSIATDGKVIYDTALFKLRLSDALESAYDPFLKVALGTLLNSLEALKSHMTFWSDGLIMNGKLNNLLLNQDNSPALVDSNCLLMAINDTIQFTSLSGWSVISHLGTSVIAISGNNILCTGAGTLYNLILSDGIN